ncbi:MULTISPECIES: GTP cyclohydrolase I [Micromonospora]|uniref:GTP cyclohydrolase I n=1 Tax=Micromonospora TaxID=1873 RepID=UPI0011989855|nr:GTP cyclohydrolase I FolE [Micromonospora sp. HM134]QDY06841.1 GTP cyclohydrolase I FolE [Micromonospora sp. HM134]
MTVIETRAPAPVQVVGADVAAAVAAAEQMLVALGVDTQVEHLRRTAERMVLSYGEMLTPTPFEATDFLNEAKHRGFVIVQDVAFAAICAHHLLPFVGSATVGYLPGARLLGLSKLARLVEHATRGVQVQENVTQQIADGLQRVVPDHGGIGVFVEAEHLCMTLRGAKARGASTVTSTWRGALERDATLRSEFLSVAGRRSRP